MRWALGTEPCRLPGVLPGAALAGSKFWASVPAQNWVPWLKITQLCFLLPVFLPGKSHGQRNLATVHGVARVRHDLATKSPLNSFVTSWFSKRTDLKPPFPAPYGLVYSDLQLISLQYHHSHAHAALQPHWTSLISLAVLYLSFLCDHWKKNFFLFCKEPLSLHHPTLSYLVTSCLTFVVSV